MNFHKCKKKYMNTDAELITCNITIQKNTYHTCYSIQNPCITGKVFDWHASSIHMHVLCFGSVV